MQIKPVQSQPWLGAWIIQQSIRCFLKLLPPSSRMECLHKKKCDKVFKPLLFFFFFFAQSRHVETLHGMLPLTFSNLKFCIRKCFFSHCFLMSFVCSWHLSQKELRLSTPLTPLLGEWDGVKERENKGERQTETHRERGTWEGNRRRDRK